jgi:Type ISP C-terminal specificity domain
MLGMSGPQGRGLLHGRARAPAPHWIKPVGQECPTHTGKIEGAHRRGVTNRRENITDWALEQFRARYGDPSITKWDIFQYLYAVLHHPEYRARYAANLRRELRRIPFVSPTGAKAQIKEDADAALKRRSSTNASSSVGATIAESSARVNASANDTRLRNHLMESPWKSGPSGPRWRTKMIHALQRLWHPTSTPSAPLSAPESALLKSTFTTNNNLNTHLPKPKKLEKNSIMASRRCA